MATRARPETPQPASRKRKADAATPAAPRSARTQRRSADARPARPADVPVVQASVAEAAALQHEAAGAAQAASDDHAAAAASGRGASAAEGAGPAAGAGVAPGSNADAGGPGGAAGMTGLPAGWPLAMGGLTGLDVAKLASVQQDYFARLQSLMLRAADPASLRLDDKRFAGQQWRDGINALSASLYLLNSETLMKMAEAFQGQPKVREQVRFAMQQWVEAMSPANYLATNPEALSLVLQTQGKSLAAGLDNLIGDIARGRISQTDESAFEVGRNMATSAGDVVWQNELFQLIQYSPVTDKVGSVPLLMVPPCINKFYILDLQPDNSFVVNAVEHGHTVFMLSWRNVGPEQGHLTWDDYLRDGVIEAIERVRDISGAKQINILGFCVGGTLLCSALAVLAARGERPCQSLTLLTTLLDFEDTGQLGMFVDEKLVRLREEQIGKGGLLAGKDLATTFSMLRPNDLVWNYVVNNYLKGEPPAAFDLLYWNADSTNLPGPMYCWYLRNTYLENRLRTPGAAQCLGQPIDLGAIDMPAFVMGAREDHIVPWRAAYASARLLGGDTHFVLGASGHIAGTMNSARKNKRSYWTSDSTAADPEQWLAAATEHKGSWWNDWSAWMDSRKGRQIPARQARSDKYPALEPAPGSYVKQRAV